MASTTRMDKNHSLLTKQKQRVGGKLQTSVQHLPSPPILGTTQRTNPSPHPAVGCSVKLVAATDTLSADGQARVCAEYVSQAYRRVGGKPGARAGQGGAGRLLSMVTFSFDAVLCLVSV